MAVSGQFTNSFQGFGNNYELLAGGKVYVTDVTTGDPVTTWSDFAKTVPNTHPVILSASGKAVIILDDGEVNIELQDSLGATIWTLNSYDVSVETITEPVLQDYFLSVQQACLLSEQNAYASELAAANSANKVTYISVIANLSTVDETTIEGVNVKGYYAENDGGGGIFNYDATIARSTANGGTIIDATGTGTGNGCWIRQYAEPMNVKWFGAKGDTTTDDTTAIQATFDNAEYVFFPQGEYKITSVISGEIKHKVSGSGSSTKLFVETATATSTTNVCFEFTDATDGSDRYAGGFISDLEIIRKTNTGGIGVYVEGDFGKKQKFSIDNVIFRGDSVSSSSPYYFHVQAMAETIRTYRLFGCRVNGNIDTTTDPSAQEYTIGFQSVGDAGDHLYSNNLISNVHTGYRFGDGVEGFRVLACNITHVVVGIDGTNTLGEPGGWINDVHINAIEAAVELSNRNAFYIVNCSLFRSSDYFDHPWQGITLTDCGEGNIQAITFKPQDIALADTINIYFEDCISISVDSCSHKGHTGFKSGGGNSMCSFSNQNFIDIDTLLFSTTATDSKVALYRHTFTAATPVYDMQATDNDSFIETLNKTNRKIASEITLSGQASPTALIPYQASTIIRYLADASTGAYTRNVDLRTDSGVQDGDMMNFRLEFEASTNPTVRFRNGSGGTLIKHFVNTAGTAGVFDITFMFDGTEWILLLSNLHKNDIV